MTDGEDVQDALTAAVAARQERDALDRRLGSARRDLEQAEGRVHEARVRLERETEDVERLESFSWTRIWTSLNGSHATALEREQAERDAVRYVVAEAESRRETAQRYVDALQAQRQALGDVDAASARALAAKEQWLLRDGAHGAELSDLAERRGRLVAREREVREAHVAGVDARNLLAEARTLLASAKSWSTWDAFGGGGLVTDLVKYSKLDQVSDLLRRADFALGRFSRELEDIGVAGVAAGVEVDGMTRTFDVFFDNIFSDLAVRSRIHDAATRVARALDAVIPVLANLEDEGRQLAYEIEQLNAEREQIVLK
jgi:hypothetical protein